MHTSFAICLRRWGWISLATTHCGTWECSTNCRWFRGLGLRHDVVEGKGSPRRWMSLLYVVSEEWWRIGYWCDVSVLCCSWSFWAASAPKTCCFNGFSLSKQHKQPWTDRFGLHNHRPCMHASSVSPTHVPRFDTILGLWEASPATRSPRNPEVTKLSLKTASCHSLLRLIQRDSQSSYTIYIT